MSEKLTVEETIEILCGIDGDLCFDETDNPRGNEALGEAVALLERLMPKKPSKKPDKYCDLIQIYYCPSCGKFFGQRGVHDTILFNKERFCQSEGCGQAIDWSEE